MLKFSYQLLVVLPGDCWHQLHFHTFRPRTMLSKMLWQRSGEGSQPRRSPKDAGGVFLALENLTVLEKREDPVGCDLHKPWVWAQKGR